MTARFLPALAAGAAMLGWSVMPAGAGGKITGITLNTDTLLLGNTTEATVSGITMLDVLDKGCYLRISLKYSNNLVQVVAPGLLVDYFPRKDIFINPIKKGLVIVKADGGGPTAPQSPQWPSCEGSAETQLMVKTKKSQPTRTRGHPAEPKIPKPRPGVT